MVRIKVCGVTCVEDAVAAAAAGADAVGMVCHAAAPRRIDRGQAAAIAAALPPFVTPVFLFVDAPATTVAEFAALTPRAWLQFHGAEEADFCTSFGRPYLKSCQPVSAADAVAAMAAHPAASGLLCDGGGGRGTAFDWDLLPAPQERSLPLVLAGGLAPGNVAAAIGRACPAAVDVSSGVCVADNPLRKDPAKLAGFVAAVRHARVH